MPQGPHRPDLMRYATVGLEFVATFGLMLACGFWLDRRLNTMPGFLLTGAAFGFAVGLYRLLRRARRLRDAEAAFDASEHRPGGDGERR